MKRGNSAVLGSLRVDYGGIRDRVNRSDKQQKANQTDDIFDFQSTLEPEEALPLVDSQFDLPTN
jgi:hypothetical protein